MKFFKLFFLVFSFLGCSCLQAHGYDFSREGDAVVVIQRNPVSTKSAAREALTRGTQTPNETTIQNLRRLIRENLRKIEQMELSELKNDEADSRRQQKIASLERTVRALRERVQELSESERSAPSREAPSGFGRSHSPVCFRTLLGGDDRGIDSHY